MQWVRPQPSYHQGYPYSSHYSCRQPPSGHPNYHSARRCNSPRTSRDLDNRSAWNHCHQRQHTLPDRYSPSFHNRCSYRHGCINASAERWIWLVPSGSWNWIECGPIPRNSTGNLKTCPFPFIFHQRRLRYVTLTPGHVSLRIRSYPAQNICDLLTRIRSLGPRQIESESLIAAPDPEKDRRWPLAILRMEWNLV